MLLPGFSHRRAGPSRECRALSSTITNIRRGQAVRRALLAIVHARHAAGLPLPAYQKLAAALGISAGQVSRHMAVLMDAGAFVPQRAGMKTKIEGIRP